MAVKFYDHNTELYHAAMYSMEQEMYGEYGDELYHYGRKGMKRGMHLPDVLDPTRELVGKIAPVANVYAKRLQRYGTGVYNSARRSLEGAGKSARRLMRASAKTARRAFKKSRVYDAYDDARAFARGVKKRFEENVTDPIKNEIAKEKWQESEAKKKKAAKAAKKKFKAGNEVANENKRAANTKDQISRLKKKAANAKTPEEAREYRNQAYELQKSESARVERESARKFMMGASSHSKSRGNAMEQLRKQNEQKAAKARYKAKQSRLNTDYSYAQSQAGLKASKAAGEKGLATAEKRERERDARIREEEQRRRDARVRAQEMERNSMELMRANYNRRRKSSRR